MPSRSAASPKPLFEDIRVLVVEDDPDLRAVVFLGLLLQGMCGDAAADGSEALQLASNRGYDVVISDIRLPGVSGIELAQRIRRWKSAPKVILVTCHRSPAVVESALEAGASRVLTKPVGLKTLAETILAVLREP
jgi:DNA-binding response OmpR family regulator